MARVAVVGSGIAGLGAAWALARRHDVVLLEADSRPGGHANTVEIPDGDRTVAVDTGFIVHNRPTYPNLVALFEALGVPTRESEMSFSVSIGQGRYEYGSSPSGFLAQPWNAFRPATWLMLRDLSRLGRAAEREDVLASREPVGPWLRRERYSRAFIDRMLLPMTAAIWSAGIEGIEDYPVGSMLAFMRNHGLLAFRDRPVWRTVVGGSREYVGRIVDALGPEAVRLGARVRAAVRYDDGVTLHVEGASDERFEHVVFATHADQALAILGQDASASERELLGAFRFQRNVAVLHRDPSFLPERARARASWNYRAERLRQPGAVSLTYWMNRLQGLETEEPVLVTLNPSSMPSGWSRTFDYEHPQYDAGTVAAQERMLEIQGVRRTWFAGAWLGHGFHEDGLRSGLAVAAALGSPAPWQEEAARSPAV